MAGATSDASRPGQPIRVTQQLLHALAPLPATAVQILSTLDDPDASLKRIGEIASRDVGIAAAILRMANSAAFGTRKRVGDIPEALRIVGTAQVRLVVLAFGVATAGKKELQFYGLPAGAFLRHSELTASLAMAICKQLRRTDAGVGYAGGLLHDMGKVLLNGVVTQGGVMTAPYRDIAAAVQAGGEPLQALELRAFGTDHSHVGGEVAALWSLPASLADAMARHHEQYGVGEPSIGAIVALANAVAGQADERYPLAQRAPWPEAPIVPVEPLFALAQDLLAAGSPSK